VKSKLIFYAQNLFFENPAVYEIIEQKNIVEMDRLRLTIWRMLIAVRILKATNTHNMQYAFLFHY